MDEKLDEVLALLRSMKEEQRVLAEKMCETRAALDALTNQHLQAVSALSGVSVEDLQARVMQVYERRYGEHREAFVLAQERLRS